MEEIRTTPEERKKQYRLIFESLYETPRITVKDVSSIVGGKQRAILRLQEAFECGYIIGPQIRERSHDNFTEYMYFLNCEDPDIAFQKYFENERVVFLAQMAGFCSLWIISKEEIAIDEEIVFQGRRSDYHVSFPPDRSFEHAMQIMRKKVRDFEFKTYVSKGIIQTHFNETIEWDEQDKSLYDYFKQDLRKKLTPVMEKYNIPKHKVTNWFKKLPECCTIFASYFPEKKSSYDQYLFMFKTDYEDFIIELFSELPTTSTFFKIGDRIFAYLHLAYQSIRTPEPVISLDQLQIPLLMGDLSKKGIIRNKLHALLERFSSRDI